MGSANVFVYVSQTANNDWVLVNNLAIEAYSPTTIHLGYTTQQYRYIAIAVYNQGTGLAGALLIDCVIVTT